MARFKAVECFPDEGCYQENALYFNSYEEAEGWVERTRDEQGNTDWVVQGAHDDE